MEKVKERLKQNKGKVIGYLALGILGVIIVLYSLNIFMEADKIKGNGLNWHTGVTNKEAREDEQKWGLVVFVVGAILIAESASQEYKILLKKPENNEKPSKSKEKTSDKLKELKKMLDEKIITEEDYEKKKKDLLNKM